MAKIDIEIARLERQLANIEKSIYSLEMRRGHVAERLQKLINRKERYERHLHLG